jgi:hypothetical protein
VICTRPNEEGGLVKHEIKEHAASCSSKRSAAKLLGCMAHAFVVTQCMQACPQRLSNAATSVED